jgi:dTDP-4-dehydrorhamnose 3,5-epimerase
MFKVSPLEILGLYLVETTSYPDDRGLFFELYNQISLAEHKIPDFVQDNVSLSKKNVIRGLHYQSEPYAQGKLVSVLKGSITDVAVDIREGSSTFGEYVSVVLDDVDRKMMYIPPGFAHGFCSMVEDTMVLYKNTNKYSPGYDYGIKWSDPDIGIYWPCKHPIVSKKDSKLPLLKDVFNLL